MNPFFLALYFFIFSASLFAEVSSDFEERKALINLIPDEPLNEPKIDRRTANETFADLSRKEPVEEDKFYYFIKPNYLFSTLNGQSKTNGAKLQLLSTNHFRIATGGGLKFEEWEIQAGLVLDWVSFETPSSGQLNNNDIHTKKVNLLLRRKVGERFSFESQINYGESFLHRRLNNGVNLYTIQTVNPKMGFGVDLYNKNNKKIHIKALGGYSFVTSDQNTSSSGGLNTYGEISFSSQKNNHQYTFGLFYEGTKGESQDFQQDFLSSGLYFQINFDF